MKLNKLVNRLTGKIATGGAFLMASTATFASTAPTATDDFFEFYNAINGWASSGLGVGIAITALVVGAVMGIGKSSPMLALSGVVMAAIISWGPALILQLVTGGAVI